MIPIVIIGAGPYGLSIASHFRHRGIPFRIFGKVMDSWVSHMPKGMLLKSDGFSCDLHDPERKYTLKAFCGERGIRYADVGIPVQLETFTAYGLAFSHRMVPELEEKLVVSLDRSPEGFVLKLDDDEVVVTDRVIVAAGITHFEYVPETLAHLPPEFLSHSFNHGDLEPFRGRNVVVMGGGASAIDLAGLLRDTDSEVKLVARKPSLQFHNKAPLNDSSSWWDRIKNPHSGLGTGIKLRFFADSPMWFHYLPQRLRLEIVRTSLGPAGGWFAREKVVGRVPLLLGYTPFKAEVHQGAVRLQLRGIDGTEREIITQHVVAATGYRVDLHRLKFLSSDIRSGLKTVEDTPILSPTFESSCAGLYFVGVAAANSFGPVLRFAYGAGFAARNLTHSIEKSLSRRRASVSDSVILPSQGRDSIKIKNPQMDVKVLAARATEKRGAGAAANPDVFRMQTCSAGGGTSHDTSSTEARMSTRRPPDAGV